MKKILVIIFLLLLIFASIRIGTSTYENFRREQHMQADFSTNLIE